MGQSILTHEIVKRSVPFVDLQDFSSLIDKCKDKKVIMLGESSHGTKEFYEWRNIITAELIQKHGFNFVAVEGDGPACQRVNDFVTRKNLNSSFDVLSNFTRWPTWMWANEEMVKFMDWLREWNLSSSKTTGFHGLDIYSLYQSVYEVITDLEELEPSLATHIQDLYSCFDPYLNNEKLYASSILHNSEGCVKEVSEALLEIMKRSSEFPDAFFSAQQNARLIANAEKYYRSTVLADRTQSWNIRDGHMMETLADLLNHYGPSSKGIVWAHNTHIGDYRATDMILSGRVNLGGLARQILGEEKVALIGLTTHSGQVTASHAWSGPIETMELNKAKTGSFEDILHDSIPFVGHEDYFLLFDDVEAGSPLLDHRGHRAVGVVYDPEHEERRNYIPSSVAKRYDGLIFIDQSTALTPLFLKSDDLKWPETYPSGDLP